MRHVGVDNKTGPEALSAGLKALGWGLSAEVEAALWGYATELLRWNEKVNLTAITAPAEVAEKHLVDSLAVLPEVLGWGRAAPKSYDTSGGAPGGAPAAGEPAQKSYDTLAAPAGAPQEAAPKSYDTLGADNPSAGAPHKSSDTFLGGVNQQAISAVAPFSLLDLGAGAGLPGIPLAHAIPQLSATLVDAVGKKVSFIKAAIGSGKLVGRVRGVHARALGEPEKEGLPRADVVISRALMDLGPWLLLARHYLQPGGRVVALLGQPRTDSALAELATPAGLALVTSRTYALPLSGDPRQVAVFHVEQG